jgi:hypothetical protein
MPYNSTTYTSSSTACRGLCMQHITTSGRSTAIGYQALRSLTTGINNFIADINVRLKYTGAESSNLLILHAGILSENNATYIGTSGSQNKFYVRN